MKILLRYTLKGRTHRGLSLYIRKDKIVNMTRKTIKFTKEEEKILKTWKHTNQLKTNTYNNYKSSIYHYTQATNMTLIELYNEAIKEEEERTPRYRKSIKTHLIEYREYLDQQDWKENTKSIYLNIIKSWYDSLDIDVPLFQNSYDRTPVTSTYEKMLTKDLIRLMMNNATTRDKAIISFATMTGQARQEIANLTIQQVMDAWNNDLEKKLFTVEDIFTYKKEILSCDVVPLKMTREKTKNRYWIYLPRETSRHIIEYIYERQAGRNEKLRIQFLHGVRGALFVNKMGNPMSPKTLGKVFDYVGKRCGFESPELFDDQTRLLLTREAGEQRVYSCHKFRKYFFNMCRRYAGTNSETLSEHTYDGKQLGDFWIGHQDKGSISHYIQYNDEDVRELRTHYLQVLPYLSVEQEVEVLTSSDKQEFLEMKKQYQQVQQELEEFREYVRQKQKLDLLAKTYGLEEI